MAFRYRQRRVADGDIIVPDDFNEDQREFIGEFNGYLDRDNLPNNAITTSYIKANAFTKVMQKVVSTDRTQYLTNDEAINGGDTQFKDMMTYTFNADVDGMLCCDWSGEWEFWDSLSATSAIPTISAAATVIMLINGVQVGIIYRASDARERDTHVMYGAFPVSAGNVTVTIRARVMTLGHTTPEVKPYGTNRYLNFNEQILVMIYRKR